MEKRILSAIMALAMIMSLVTVNVSAREEFVKYDVFDNLDFETQSYAQWTNGTFGVEGQDDPITYIQNGEGDFAAQSGSGAVYIGGTGAVSIWGSTVSGVVAPKEGDLICGTYWLKVMEETPGDWKQPQIKIKTKRNDVEVDLAITKDLNSFSVWECGRFKWSQLEIESTGNEYKTGDVLTYEIVNNGSKLKFMIDNIELGAYREFADEVVVPEGTIFKPYNIYDLLKFEDATQFVSGANYYSGANDGVNYSVTFVKDDENYSAYEGSGAVYIDCTKGGYSFWSASNAATEAVEGEEMCGYIMFKFMQPHYDAEQAEANGSKWYKLPKITVKNSTTGEILCQYDPEADSILNYDQGIWYKLPLTTTGASYTNTDLINYTIENIPGTGIKFMLDDLTLGRYVEDDHGVITVTAAPKVDAFGDFNSDFENIDPAAGTPSNWGQYTPNSANDTLGNGCNYLTDSMDAWSGISMLEFVRGATLWSIQPNVEGKTGKPIGGYYMLYVGENSDLTKNYPRVFVKYATAEGSEVIVAESPSHDNAFAVVPGEWNKIPILPVEGVVVPEDAKNVTLMVEAAAITTDVNNAPYSDIYYLDNIVIGSIVEDLYISDDTTMDYDGANMNCNVIISNAKTDSYVFGEVIVAVYEDGRLIGVNSAPEAVVARKGSLGYSSSKTEVSVPVTLGEGELSISIFFWDSLGGMTPLCQKKNN